MRWLLCLLLAGCSLPPPHLTSPAPLPGAARVAEGANARCRGDAHAVRCEAQTFTTTVEGRLEDRREVELRPAPNVVVAAPVARHPLVAPALGAPACAFDDDGCRFTLRYGVRGPRSRLAIVAPRGFSLSTHHTSDQDEEQLVAVMTAPRAFASPGGPFLDVGARFDGVRPAVPAGRLGWELFAPASLGHGLSVDTDGDRWRAAYAAELVSPRVWILPSVGLGLGLPVQVAPTVSTGVRAQASLQLSYVGVVAWTDWMPGLDDPWLTTVALRMAW